jgi:hypothetical protein
MNTSLKRYKGITKFQNLMAKQCPLPISSDIRIQNMSILQPLKKNKKARVLITIGKLGILSLRHSRFEELVTESLSHYRKRRPCGLQLVIVIHNRSISRLSSHRVSDARSPGQFVISVRISAMSDISDSLICLVCLSPRNSPQWLHFDITPMQGLFKRRWPSLGCPSGSSLMGG